MLVLSLSPFFLYHLLILLYQGNIAYFNAIFFYLDDSDQEPLLILLMHGPTDGSDGPAQGVEVLPGPFSAVNLVVKLLCHYAFCVCIIQVSQVHCRMVQKKRRFLSLACVCFIVNLKTTTSPYSCEYEKTCKNRDGCGDSDYYTYQIHKQLMHYGCNFIALQSL